MLFIFNFFICGFGCFLFLLCNTNMVFSKKNIGHIIIISMTFNFHGSHYFLYIMVILVLTFLIFSAIVKQISKLDIFNRMKYYFLTI